MYAEKPWLKFYDPHVPPSLEYPTTPLPIALAETARRCPDHPALIFKGNVLTYRQYNELVDRFAAALQDLGVAKGDRVAIHLPNCPQYPIAFFAVLRCGAIVVPCNPVYTARELKHQLADSGAETIITLSSTYAVVRQAMSETRPESGVRLRRVIVTRIKTFFPPLLRLLFTLLREKKMGHRLSLAGAADAMWFEDLIARSAGKIPKPVDIGLEDTAILLYTGGTTGISKAAELTHRNILANAYQVLVWAKIEERSDSILAVLPLFHSYGMTTCMTTGALKANTAVMIPDPRDTRDILESIHKYQPKHYPGVPAMYVAINNHPEVHKYNLRSLKACVSGAAPLPVEVQQRFQELTGARLVEGYGLSEASPITHSNPLYGDNRIGTIGLPWPDTEARIVDAETGERILPPGEIGELVVRGPQVMRGYWNMPTETANALRPDPDGGLPWLHTGDLATMDEDGYFRIVDRKKDMILGAGGFNIYPREIEDVLYEHPKVREAAAVGVYVPEKGQRVKVFIVLKEGESATEEEIIEFCKERLAPYKVPKMVEFRQQLPKSMVGKILRRALVEEERSK